MTGYSDVAIPLIIGLLFFFFPDILIKKKDASFERRSKTLKWAGIVLVCVATGYFIIKQFS